VAGKNVIFGSKKPKSDRLLVADKKTIRRISFSKLTEKKFVGVLHAELSIGLVFLCCFLLPLFTRLILLLSINMISILSSSSYLQI
jgi:hypothetical protein